MFIQRGEGELYLQCGAGMRQGELPPQVRGAGEPSTGWLERVDPQTLDTMYAVPAGRPDCSLACLPAAHRACHLLPGKLARVQTQPRHGARLLWSAAEVGC